MAELHRKDKDQENYLSQAKPDMKLQKSLAENYLVSQLKKQIRGLKYELQRANEHVASLKTSVKLARSNELESENLAYQEECQRLRTLLEAQVIESDL